MIEVNVMKQTMKEYMFDRLKNQQGAVGMLTAAGISLLSLLGAAVYFDVEGAFDEYVASLSRLHNGESTVEDLHALHNALNASGNAAGALVIPGSAPDVLAMSLGQLQGYAFQIGIADTPAPPLPPPAGTSLSSGCSMTLSSISVKPGDTITATLTTPALLHSKIGNISCEAGVVGFGISIPGGTSPVSIPNNIEANSLTVKCYVIAAEGGDTICSPAVNVDVVHEETEGTCFARGLVGPEVVTWKGREWQRCNDSNKYNWEEAKAYCSNLTLSGHSDWRLPTKTELKSLVVCTNGTPTPLEDYYELSQGYGHPYYCGDGNGASYDTPTIDGQFSCQSTYYWSSSVSSAHDANGGATTWLVSFGEGGARIGSRMVYFYARCAR